MGTANVLKKMLTLFSTKLWDKIAESRMNTGLESLFYFYIFGLRCSLTRVITTSVHASSSQAILRISALY